MIKAIIFDWGGVLAPSDNKIAAIRLGESYDIDEDKFKSFVTKLEDDLCDIHDDTNFLNEVSKRFNIPINSLIDALNADPPDEDFEIAKNLSDKYEVFILSNQLKFRTDYIKKNFNLSFFKDVFFSNEIGLKKPDKKIFEYLLKNIEYRPDECLFIDDSEENILVAQKFGFKTIHFLNLIQLKQELAELSIS